MSAAVVTESVSEQVDKYHNSDYQTNNSDCN